MTSLPRKPTTSARSSRARPLDLRLAARDRAPLPLGRGAQRLLLRAQVCEVRAVREGSRGGRPALHRLQHLAARRGLPPAALLDRAHAPRQFLLGLRELRHARGEQALGLALRLLARPQHRLESVLLYRHRAHYTLPEL